MMSQTRQQIVTIHTLRNISSKPNQKMKSSQVTECNMRNIFLKKLYTACGGEAGLTPCHKNYN